MEQAIPTTRPHSDYGLHEGETCRPDVKDEYASEMMREYPDFLDYLKTTPSYTDIRRSVLGTKEYRAAEETQLRFSLNIKKKAEQEPFVVEEAPMGWEDEFNECYDEFQLGIRGVNEHIQMGRRVYPDRADLLRAFDLVPLKDVRVVIIGQDPYHNGSANGLAFSANGEVPKSLKTVFKEIKRTHGEEPISANLDFWAYQGVLLLNTCLTVNESAAGSHKKIWFPFIRGILNILFEKTSFCILCLWGKKAQDLVEGRDKITVNKNVIVLKAGHPSPLNTSSAVPFMGCNHFVDINRELEKRGLPIIDWIGREFRDFCGGEISNYPLMGQMK
jgi:uracil-DNA glycosylase